MNSSHRNQRLVLLEHCLNKTRPLSSVFLTVLVFIVSCNCPNKLVQYSPLMVWPFWRYSINTMPFASPINLRWSSSLQMKWPWPSLELARKDVFTEWIVSLSPVQRNEANTCHGLGSVQGNQLDLPLYQIFPVMWPAYKHFRSNTFVTPSSQLSREIYKQHQLFDLLSITCHPSQCCEHNQCFPLMWQLQNIQT